MAAHPELAESLEACLSRLEWVHAATQQHDAGLERLASELDRELAGPQCETLTVSADGSRAAVARGDSLLVYDIDKLSPRYHQTTDQDVYGPVTFSPDSQLLAVGRIHGALRDLSLFHQVRLDPEVQTLVWPNGADFDPATLHDWAENLPAMKSMAERWAQPRPHGGPLAHS